MKFLNPLYEYRRALGYSQPDIVALANVSQSTLSKWESGQCTPDGATLKKISSHAREDIERFMGAKVYMQTWVKVKENWRDNLNYIRSFGYDEQ